MADQFIAPPINPVISIRPLSTPLPGRDATNVQTELAVLPAGTTLEGFVINRDPSGNPILRTPVGDLQMQSDVFVKTGSQMVIRVDATSDTRARIISIDGLMPQDYAAQSARGLTQDTISSTQMFTPGLAGKATPAMPLQAMLLSPTTPAAVASNPLFAALPPSVVPPALMKLQAGAALKVTLVDMHLPDALMATPAPSPRAQAAPRTPVAGELPAASLAAQPPMEQASMAAARTARVALQTPPAPASAAPAPASPLPQTPAAATPYPPAQAPQSQAPSAPRFVPGLPMAAAAATPPTSTQASRTAAPSRPSPAGEIAGLVLGHEADGGNIVQTKFGMLKVFSPSPLPLHAQVSLQVEPDHAAPTPVPFTPVQFPEDGTDTLNSLSREWPQLEKAMEQVQADDTPLARDMMQALPQVGHKLASGMLFFMAAVKGGDLKQWLGNRALAALEAKSPEIAGKLKSDMAQLQQLFLHSPLDQWTGVMVPMLYQGQLEYARLYLRDEPDGGDDGKAATGNGREQRFIVDVELSHLGDMQFDGFVRPTATKKQFDLMIRTARPLDPAMTNDIRGLFETAIAATGYQGYLGFQQGPQHFVRPLAASPGSGRPDDHHTILA